MMDSRESYGGVGSIVTEVLKVLVPGKQASGGEPPFNQGPNIIELRARPRWQRWFALRDRISIATKSFLEYAVNKLSKPQLYGPRRWQPANSRVAILETATQKAEQVTR